MSNINETEKDVAGDKRHPREELTDSRIWEVIDEIMLGVPDEVLNRLPTDGAEQHDYYLRGVHGKAPQKS